MTRPIIHTPASPKFRDRPGYIKPGPRNEDYANWTEKKREISNYFNRNILVTIKGENGKRSPEKIFNEWRKYIEDLFLKHEIDQKQRDHFIDARRPKPHNFLEP